jgi:hypothetical protein
MHVSVLALGSRQAGSLLAERVFLIRSMLHAASGDFQLTDFILKKPTIDTT